MEQDAFELFSSPHLKGPIRTETIMRNVVYALLPVAAFGVFVFGLSVLLLLVVSTGVCLATEYVLCRLSGKENTLHDYSAAITGIILALVLPPGFPLWMAAVGGFVSIALGKALFGGLGLNIFNPALVGRAFLQATFPVAMTTWTPPLVPGRFAHLIPSTAALPFLRPAPVAEYIRQAAVDGFTGATPLSLMKFQHVSTDSVKLFLGMTGGSAGETGALVILLCGAYLLARRMMDWRIPAAVLGSVFVVSGVFFLLAPDTNPSPVFMLCSGGVMLGAMFMATDMVTSPTTPAGAWLFGMLIGALTVVIRLKGAMPEGVMYAILIANGVTPLVDALTQPRVYGTRRIAQSK